MLAKKEIQSVTGSTVAAVATLGIMGGTTQLELCTAPAERVLLLEMRKRNSVFGELPFQTLFPELRISVQPSPASLCGERCSTAVSGFNNIL